MWDEVSVRWEASSLSSRWMSDVTDAKRYGALVWGGGVQQEEAEAKESCHTSTTRSWSWRRVHEQVGRYLPRGTTEDFGESSWEGELWQRHHGHQQEDEETGGESGNCRLEPFLRAKHQDLDIPWTKRTPDLECGGAQGNGSFGKQLLRISRSTGPLWKVQRHLRWPTLQNSEFLQIWPWSTWKNHLWEREKGPWDSVSQG